MPRSTKNPMATGTPNSALVLRSGRVIPRMMGNEAHDSTTLTSDQNHEVAVPPFPFLQLSAELRIQIYRYLLHAQGNIRISEYDAAMAASLADAGKPQIMRHFPDKGFSISETGGKTRPYSVAPIGLHPAILSVNRQTHSEASRIMYSENRFGFYGIHYLTQYEANAAAVPFLESLSEDSLRLIKQIELDFVVTDLVPLYLWDPRPATMELAFSKICNYLGQNLQLRNVTLVFLIRLPKYLINPASFKDDLVAHHGKNWVQHLVPFVGSLDTCEVTAHTVESDGLVDTVSEYLKSKIPQASKTTFRLTENPDHS